MTLASARMIDLATTTWGDGPKRALLLHGLSSNAAGWWRVGPDLARLGFTVTAPDQRGHGRSPGAGDYSYAAMAGDLAALGDGWDVVLGHSMGGGVAVTAAAARPGWAKRLILEDPALRAGDVEGVRDWLLDPYEGEMSPQRIASEQPRWEHDDCVAKAEAILQSSPDVVIGYLDANLDADLVPAAIGLSVPTLLIGADPDYGGLVPRAGGEKMAAMSPHLTYVVIPQSGHSIHRDSYEPFWDAVRGFLAEG